MDVKYCSVTVQYCNPVCQKYRLDYYASNVALKLTSVNDKQFFLTASFPD